jgi:hypothetical protein
MKVIRDRLAGRWRLAAYEAASADGAVTLPMGPGAIGVLDYSADGKVSVHIMTRAADRYFAYYGDYTVDEQAPSVTHLIEMSSEPTFVGASNLRYVSLEGEGAGSRLVLSGPMTLAGKPHTIRVVWEREAD